MTEVAVLVLAVLVGFYIKGLSGMGEAIPLAAVGVLVVSVTDLVVIITILDLLGSAFAMWASRMTLVRRADAPYVFPLVLGIAAGVAVLALAPRGVLLTGFFASLLVVGVLMARSALVPVRERVRARPDRWSPLERTCTATYAGFSGGITGIDGPPLAFSLFRTQGLVDIRQQLMRLILISSAVRFVMLAVSGVVTWRLLAIGIILIPCAVGAFVLSRRLHAGVHPRLIAGLCGSLCIASVLFAVMRY